MVLWGHHIWGQVDRVWQDVGHTCVPLLGWNAFGIPKLRLVKSKRILGFPGGSDGKEFACNVGSPGWIPSQLGRSPGEGNGNPIQYSCLENPVDKTAWQAIVHGVTKSPYD